MSFNKDVKRISNKASPIKKHFIGFFQTYSGVLCCHTAMFHTRSRTTYAETWILNCKQHFVPFCWEKAPQCKLLQFKTNDTVGCLDPGQVRSAQLDLPHSSCHSKGGRMPKTRQLYFVFPHCG